MNNRETGGFTIRAREACIITGPENPNAGNATATIRECTIDCRGGSRTAPTALAATIKKNFEELGI